MMRLTTPWRMVAAFGAAGLLLAGCGTDTNDVTTGGETTEPTTDTTPTTGGEGGGDGTLTIGTLLPQTGDLAFLGPPEFAGVDLAVEEINKAGGVLGQDVKQVRADSGDGTPNIAPSETDKLLRAKADVIIGAASSSVSLSVIDKITGAGVVQISPANTSTVFDTYEDKGLYFRTAPSDVLQGRVLANTVLEDQHTTLGLIVRQDSYGKALADNVEKFYTESGGQIVAKELYDANASNFTAEINAVAAEDPEAIVLIAFDETLRIIPDMIEQGIGPEDKQIYFVDGNLADYSEDLPPGTLEGVKGTLPGPDVGDAFRDRLKTVDPKLTEFAYGPESYDATILAALAAIAAGGDSGQAIADKLIEMSSGGTECTEFAECKTMLENGEDIDYNGVSGPVEFNETGSPSKATIGIYQYNKDNTFESVKFVEGEI